VKNGSRETMTEEDGAAAETWWNSILLVKAWDDFYVLPETDVSAIC